jgi:AGZA family xanthine/uracil permease-like MFS transporter
MFGFVLLAVPAIRKVPGAILVGIVATALLAFLVRTAPPPNRIDFGDYSESIPSFGVVALMAFTFNMAIGISAGFVLYPICTIAAGKREDLRPGLWILTALSLLFFVFYPYG